MRNIVGLALISLLFVVGSSARAQQPGKVYRLGFLSIRSEPGPLDEAFKQSLRELGYTEGKNYSVAYRWAEGKFDRFPALAAELVQLKVDVLVTEAHTPSAAKDATSTITIPMTNNPDPVGSGLIVSLAKPGGNVTGLSTLSTDLVGKWLQLVKEALPRLTRVAMLSNPVHPNHSLRIREAEVAARALKVRLQIVEARTSSELARAFAAATKESAEALLNPDPKITQAAKACSSLS